MAFSFKDKAKKALESRENKKITLTQKELNKLVEDRANEILDKEVMSKLPDEFLRQVSGEIDSQTTETEEEKSEEEQADELLKLIDELEE